MATAQSRPMQSLRRAALLPAVAGATDEQLLDRFVEQRDDIAFEVLVRRHGPMVLGVARRLGWPQGTLSVRLMRGREMLAKRLTRHDLAVSAGSLALLCSQNASASVPSALTGSTLQAAGFFAASQAAAAGAISSSVAKL